MPKKPTQLPKAGMMELIKAAQKAESIEDLETSIKYTKQKCEDMRQKFQQMNFFLAEMRKRLKELKKDTSQ